MKIIAQKKSFSVLIPDGDTNNTLSIVRCLGEEKNITIFVLSNEKNKPVRYSRYISKFKHYSSGETKEQKLAVIMNAIKETNADILLPIDVETIRLVSEHKEEFSKLIAIVPIPDVNSFDTADDKWLLSLWLRENNISHPKTMLFNSTNCLDEVISSIKFPLIIKSRNGLGGGGINIVRNTVELHSWYNEFDNSEDQIIQSYIKGFDIDCSVLCLKGRILANTIQKSLKYETDSLWPYGLDFQENDEIYNIVKKVVEKFKWSGVVHIDLRYDEQAKQIKLIEMNPRFWASVSASIFAGANFPYFSCLIGLGRELPEIIYKNKIVFNTMPAFKMILRKFTKKSYLNFDNTYFELNIKDPIPTIMKEIFKYYK